MPHSVSSPVQDQSRVFTTEALKVDLLKRQVVAGDMEVHLTPILYRLLPVLIKNAGKVCRINTCSRKPGGRPIRIIRIICGFLKQKLETGLTRPQYLLTESGVGLPA
jgi:two-component system KDP operon response regulator KdpE